MFKTNLEQAVCIHMLVSCGLLTCSDTYQTAWLRCMCMAHLLQSPRTALCNLGHQVPSPP